MKYMKKAEEDFGEEDRRHRANEVRVPLGFIFMSSCFHVFLKN
jgi:hypothetical protein